MRSADGGRTWSFLSRVNDWGAPGDLVDIQEEIRAQKIFQTDMDLNQANITPPPSNGFPGQM